MLSLYTGSTSEPLRIEVAMKIERETAHMAALVHDAGAIAYPDEDPAAYCAPAEAQLEQLVWGGYEPFFTDEHDPILAQMLQAMEEGFDGTNRAYLAPVLSHIQQLE